MSERTKKKPAALNSVGLAGEFAVLSQLLMNGVHASLTLGNAKGVDILVSTADGSCQAQIEIKSIVAKHDGGHRSKTWGEYLSGWIMHEKHEARSSENLWFCFVLFFKKNGAWHNRRFVVHSREVSAYVAAQHKYWLKSGKGRNPTMMRQFRLGKNELGMGPRMKPASECEDRWDLIVGDNPKKGGAVSAQCARQPKRSEYDFSNGIRGRHAKRLAGVEK